MAGSVQAIGIPDTVAIYEMRDIDTWAVFQGSKNLIHAGSDAAELTALLEKLEATGFATSYTLKVYRDTDPQQVTDKTPAHGAINFKLQPGGAVSGAYGYGVPSPYNAVNGELIKRIEKLEKEKTTDEKPASIGAVVMDWLQNPEKLATVLNAVGSLMRKEPGGPARLLQAMGNVSRVSSPKPVRQAAPDAVGNEGDDPEVVRLEAALEIMEENDPQFIAHMEKLASIAKNKPQQFKMLLQMLDNF